MALPDTPDGWLNYLKPVLLMEQSKLRQLNNEYELIAPRLYMHPELFREIGDRVEQVVIAWPQLVVDSIEERLDPQGFRLPDSDDADDEMWRVWQANKLDLEAQLGRVDALVMKRSYLCVGTNEKDPATPLVTVESPLEVYADIDPRTHDTRAAIRYYNLPTLDGRMQEEFATVYMPDMTVWYDSNAAGGFREIHRDVHNLGVVPVVPMVNRARLSDRYGKSELSPVLPLAHAANKLATDMMVGAEFLALPLRGIMGMTPEDLVDEKGNQVSALKAMLGRLLAIPNSEGKMFEFSAADLKNFHSSINALAALVASIAGLPPHYLGFTTDNPASADAIRSSEMRLVKRAERKTVPFGDAYEQTMRLVRRFQAGDWDPKLQRLETIWRDPATPTVAQSADAAVKKKAEGIISRRQAQEDSGYTDAQIRRMTAEFEEEARQDPLAEFARQTAGGNGPASGGQPTHMPEQMPANSGG